MTLENSICQSAISEWSTHLVPQLKNIKTKTILYIFKCLIIQTEITKLPCYLNFLQSEVINYCCICFLCEAEANFLSLVLPYCKLRLYYISSRLLHSWNFCWKHDVCASQTSINYNSLSEDASINQKWFNLFKEEHTLDVDYIGDSLVYGNVIKTYLSMSWHCLMATPL